MDQVDIKKDTFLLGIIRWMGCPWAAVHLLIRLYVGIRGYCAINTNGRQPDRVWYQNERNKCAEWYQSRQKKGMNTEQAE
jgi:hypothetical protein